MSAITCWLNTSATKSTLWLKPKSDAPLKSNPFLNLGSRAEVDMLVTILREAFARGVSYEVSVDLADIVTTKSGSLAVQSTLAKVLNSMTETVKAEAKPVDDSTVALANEFLNSLAKRPVVAVEDTDDDYDF